MTGADKSKARARTALTPVSAEVETKPANPPCNEVASPGTPGWIVGIGASAGGLEALTRLLGGLPPLLDAALDRLQVD